MVFTLYPYKEMYSRILLFAGVIIVAMPTSTLGLFFSTLECSKPCTNTEAIVAPHCNHTTKVEPEYDACGCLTGYQCCPTACPKPLHDCRMGYEIPVNITDCCGCQVIRCDPCPKIPTPVCTPGCEIRKTLLDIMNSCYYDSCKVICPQMDQIVCPNCHEPVSFKNDSFCRCTQQKCVKKSCPPKTVLPYKNCALRKWAKTECGCDKQFYDTANYCDSDNAIAAANTCSDKCFKSVVRRGKGTCGCDKAECVRISEDCKQVFPNWNCPPGSVKVMGTTPCGLDRENCVKCDGLKPVSCDPDCYKIVQEKDVNGCPVKRCVRKACPIPSLPNNCPNFQSTNMSVNKCGCVGWDKGNCFGGHVTTFPDGSVYSLHSEQLTWPEARRFCLTWNMHLAVIETRQEESRIRDLVKETHHWVGAQCIQNSTGNFYFWESADGKQIPFDLTGATVPSAAAATVKGNIDTCDTKHDGITLKEEGANTYDDRNSNQKHAFICEKP